MTGERVETQLQSRVGRPLSAPVRFRVVVQMDTPTAPARRRHAEPQRCAHDRRSGRGGDSGWRFGGAHHSTLEPGPCRAPPRAAAASEPGAAPLAAPPSPGH